MDGISDYSSASIAASAAEDNARRFKAAYGTDEEHLLKLLQTKAPKQGTTHHNMKEKQGTQKVGQHYLFWNYPYYTTRVVIYNNDNDSEDTLKESALEFTEQYKREQLELLSANSALRRTPETQTEKRRLDKLQVETKDILGVRLAEYISNDAHFSRWLVDLFRGADYRVSCWPEAPHTVDYRTVISIDPAETPVNEAMATILRITGCALLRATIMLVKDYASHQDVY